MPGYDGSGPLGNGAMTGRGRGYCALPVTGTRMIGTGRRMGFGAGFAGRGRGRGAGFGMGQGRGLGFGQGAVPPNTPGMTSNMPYQAMLSPDQEITLLNVQAADIRSQLQVIEQRLADLRQSDSES